MKKNTLKLSMVAAAISLSTLAAPVAHAGQLTGQVSRDSGVGHLIAAQGNAALHRIRAELKAARLAQLPSLPAAARATAHPTQVAGTPAGGAGPVSANARCAK